MADSDGEYVADDMSDDDLMDHTVTDETSAARTKSSRARKGDRKSAAWEKSKRTWETNLPEEDQDGILNLTALEAEKRKRLLRDTTPLQRGIIRHLVLVLDMSFAMVEKDLLPTRYRLMLNYAASFVREFFEQNPISQLGIIGMRDGVAVRISDVGGNPSDHLERLKELEPQDPQGNPSLQNALEMCRGALLYGSPTSSFPPRKMRLLTTTAMLRHTARGKCLSSTVRCSRATPATFTRRLAT